QRLGLEPASGAAIKQQNYGPTGTRSVPRRTNSTACSIAGLGVMPSQPYPSRPNHAAPSAQSCHDHPLSYRQDTRPTARIEYVLGGRERTAGGFHATPCHLVRNAFPSHRRRLGHLRLRGRRISAWLLHACTPWLLRQPAAALLHASPGP